MENQQINVTPMELATISELLQPLIEDKTLPCDKAIRICRDAAGDIHVYGADRELLVIDPNQSKMQL